MPVHVSFRSFEQMRLSHTRPMYIRFHKDIDPANSVKIDLLVLVFPPVAHKSHVFSTSIVLFVAFSKNNVLVQAC